MRSRFFCVFLGLAMGWTMAGAPAGASALGKGGEKPDPTKPPYTTRAAASECCEKGISTSCPDVNGSRLAIENGCWTCDQQRRRWPTRGKATQTGTSTEPIATRRPNPGGESEQQEMRAKLERSAPKVWPGPILCLHSADGPRPIFQNPVGGASKSRSRSDGRDFHRGRSGASGGSDLAGRSPTAFLDQVGKS